MSRSLRARLAGLMFLQYFVMGLWAVTLVSFLMGSPHEGGLNLSARHVGLIYSTFAIAATVSPLFVGLLADRLFATQRVLAALHLVGAVLLVALLWTSNAHLEEVEHAFNKLALVEPVGEDELWRLLWERDSIQVYLAAPGAYNSPRAWPLQAQLYRLWQALGITPRRPVSTNHPRTWPTEEAALARLDELERRIPPALQRVRTHPELLAAAERAFPPLFGLTLEIGRASCRERGESP